MYQNEKLLSTLVFMLGLVISLSANSKGMNDGDVSKGKYLIEVGGCNDCHTSGYAPSGGEVPEEQWLLGDGLGFRGPWGTTYALNLRQYMGKYSESEWVAKAKTLKTRPPMPWWAVNAMNESDLKSLYKYIKSLGVVNNAIPSYVPPDEEPNTPYIQWPMPPK